jgi:putative GTP pyrophosphokinase
MGSEPFDFEARRREAIEAYQRVRPHYVAFADVVQRILEQALRAASIRVASIESRAKSLESFGDKAAAPSVDDPAQPRYTDPLVEIEDVAAARVITFFLHTIDDVDRLIHEQFSVRDRLDKSDLLLQEEKLGYHSVHYIVQLNPGRCALPEYAMHAGTKAEIQLRTVLQHAWAEIEHDIQYKAIETIPRDIRRRFMALAGVLEIADREFQAIQREDEKLRQAARTSVRQGRLEQVEITGDALKAYLDKKLGADGRMAKWSYDYTARSLLRLGFRNFRQVEQSVAVYDDDQLSRAIHGRRQGQITRFEDMLLAALGDRYIGRLASPDSGWWREWLTKRLEKIRTLDVPVEHYDPLADEVPTSANGNDGTQTLTA